MLVLIGQLEQALTVNDLEHKLLGQVAKVYARLAPGIGRRAVLRIEAHVLADAGALAYQVDVMHGLAKLAKLCACLGIVEINLAQAEQREHVDIAFLGIIVLADYSTEDGVVVRVAVRSGIAIIVHLHGSRLVEVPRPVLESDGQIEPRLPAVELL